MATETNDGLIIEPTLHLCLNEHAIRALATAARKSNLHLIAEQIEAQLPKAPVEEPTEAYSLIRARWMPDGAEEPVVFIRARSASEDAGSEYSWGTIAAEYSFAGMADVEVLRVGAGEPTPEQVEAASAPDWARLDASNAESDAIDALVQEFATRKWAPEEELDARWHYFITPNRIREIAARVLEVGGQQPGVPVESVRGTARYLRHQGTEHPEGSEARFAYIQAEAILKKLLEPTS